MLCLWPAVMIEIEFLLRKPPVGFLLESLAITQKLELCNWCELPQFAWVVHEVGIRWLQHGCLLAIIKQNT
jgi:hypothetical protein